MSEFQPFGKIPRLNREWVATEKIDGTNGVVHIDEDGVVRAGSRRRWITPEDDNAGFAAWVRDNAEELRQLGPGFHYGEWWGPKIQRKYEQRHRRFSLFNATRWSDDAVRPRCCGVVPVLASGVDVKEVERKALATLRERGSVVAPGFMRPEGVVLFHAASRTLFKVTLENDAESKEAAKRRRAYEETTK